MYLTVNVDILYLSCWCRVIDGEGPDILPILVQSNSLTYDLSTEEKFDVSQQYSVQVIAVNGIGDSMPSMAVTFQREATSKLIFAVTLVHQPINTIIAIIVSICST